MTDAIEFVARGGFTLRVAFDGDQSILQLEVDGHSGEAACTSAKDDSGIIAIPRSRRHAVRKYARIPTQRATRYLATYTIKDGLRLYERGGSVPYVIADSFVPVAQRVRITARGLGVGRVVHVRPHSPPMHGWRLKEPWE